MWGQMWKNLKNLAAYGFVVTTGSTGRKKLEGQKDFYYGTS
jgi:hypothetical protein